jgi:hypothetical protein
MWRTLLSKCGRSPLSANPYAPACVTFAATADAAARSTCWTAMMDVCAAF